MPRPFLHPHPQSGFSLLELSAVLAIIAIVTAATFSMGSSMIESARRVSTNNKLDAIEEALLAFRLANNRLPCPTDAALTDIPANSATYGYEASNASGSCTGGSPAANYSYTLPAPPSNTNITGGTVVAEGAVPVKSLGLPDEFQWDGWGHKFAYAVWTPLTAGNAFITYGVTPNCGAITVQNAGGGNRTTAGAYALVSFGPNGHGSYLKTGTRYFMGTENNAAEKTNCHCNGTADLGNYAATYVEQDVTQTNPADSYSVFDDIVRFKDRWQMQNAYDTYTPNGASCWLGFHVDGGIANYQSGYSVAVGDVNGDGIPDLIIGTPQANGFNGAIYVVFGTKSGFPDPLPLSSLNGTNGFELDGTVRVGEAGYSVAVGDINGDGIPDLIIGVPDILGAASGAVYVVFGGPTMKDGTHAWTACSPCTLDNTGAASSVLNGTNGIEFYDAAGTGWAGWSVATGDINGDGVADVIIGDPNDSAYVVFGGATKKDGTSWASGNPYILNSTLLNGTNGAEFNAPAGSMSIGAVAAGDFNGDGNADLIIDDDYGSSGAGAVYVVFGKNSGWASQTTLASGSPPLDGTHGVEFDGVAVNTVGGSVAAGDVNGDGIADLIIGSNGSNSNAGSVYVVFGNKTWSRSQYTLDNNVTTGIINGTTGVEFDGAAANDGAGWSVAAGDINGDDYADIIIGASGANSSAGAAYIVFGGSTKMNNNAGGSNIAWSSCTPGNCMLSNIGSYPVTNGSNGFELDGTATSQAGASLASGDIDGNGIQDIIIGAPGTNSSAGSTYIYFGHKNTSADPWPATPFSLGGL